MSVYLVVYNVSYKEKTTPEEALEEIKYKLEKIKKMKDRTIFESIYEILQLQLKNIGSSDFPENLVIDSEFQGIELLDFIRYTIKEKRPCNEKQYLEISIKNIINLEQNTNS